jgi:hypothetical protein
MNTAAAVAEAPVILTPPRIGEVWPGQGGIFVGRMRAEPGTDKPEYYLILAPTDVESNVVKKVRFSDDYKSVPGACSDWDGLENTKAQLAASHKHPAAEAISAVEHEGHRDFYLGARRELALVWAAVPERIAGFGWCWSSTEYSAGSAYGQYSDDGDQYDFYKGLTGRAFAVRRVVIQ